MVRPFDWRDFGFVHRLSEQGVCFDTEAALTRGPHVLQAALMAFLAPGIGSPTFVCRTGQHNGGGAFGQFRFRSGDEHARLNFIAPGHADDGAWNALLECLTADAASRGAHNLVAEVNEKGAEFEILRRFGFAIYARQDLWKLAGLRPPAAAARLRPQQSVDNFGIRTLYANTVPRLIQQVEPPPPRYAHGYVLEENGEYVAHFDVSRGPLGVWVQPYLHPGVFDHSAVLLADLVRQLTERNTTPVPIFVCVRSHQDWLRSPLTNLGFEAWGEQAVMVKRLAVRVGELEFKPLPVIAGSKVPSQMIKSQ
ncbi:MAG: hypothetical protein AAB427_09990 [Chloroflexota bacterium]